MSCDLPLVLPQPESVKEAHYQSRQSDCHDGKEHVAVVENEGGEGVADQCTQVQVEQVRVLNTWTCAAEDAAAASAVATTTV